MTPEIVEEINVLVRIETNRLGMILDASSRLIVGPCTDGIVIIVPTVAEPGKKAVLALLRVSESTLKSTGSRILMDYFASARLQAQDSMETFVTDFRIGYKMRTGSTSFN